MTEHYRFCVHGALEGTDCILCDEANKTPKSLSETPTDAILKWRNHFFTAQATINEIDDLLEYRWQHYTAEELRDEIVGMIHRYGIKIAKDLGR